MSPWAHMSLIEQIKKVLKSIYSCEDIEILDNPYKL